MSKLLVVFGATGNQGGSVVNYVLNDPELSKEYRVRAITRDPSSKSSQPLKDKGAEVVKADLEDEASVKAALEGAHAVFLVTTTTYDDKLEEREYNIGKTVADLIVAAGAKILVYSSLSHSKDLSDGKITHLQSFDVKAEVERYIRTLPIQSAFFAPGSFMQNFEEFQAPRPVGEGVYAIFNFTDPGTKIPLTDTVGDTGKWVGAVLADPEAFDKTFFAASTKLYTWTEIAEIMSAKSGKKVVYNQLPLDVFKSFFPPNMAPYFIAMFTWIQDFGYYGPGTEEQVNWAAGKARGQPTTLEEYFDKSPVKI